MIIEVDLSMIPPQVTLKDPDDFKGFQIVTTGTHAFVELDELKALAGEHARDPDWLRQLEAMQAYAQSKGWTDADGAIRAHIEHR